MPEARSADPDPSMFLSAAGWDKLVLATVNAPFKRTISAQELVACLSDGRGPWRVHVNAFLNDVRPDLVLKFAAAHGVSAASLDAAYRANAALSGARNPSLEAALATVVASP